MRILCGRFLEKRKCVLSLGGGGGWMGDFAGKMKDENYMRNIIYREVVLILLVC